MFSKAIYHIIITTFVVGLFCLASPAQAASNYVTGKELQKLCTSPFDTDYGYCAGFVTGVADVMLQQVVSGKKSCHKPSIKSQQLVDLVVSYMEHNPETKKHTARSIVAETLSRSFPCTS